MRCAIVTGGSRGIGKEIVAQLAGRGVNVLFTFRAEPERANALIDSLSSLPGEVVAQRFDLASGVDDSLVAAALDRWGRLDALILNAGVWDGGRVDRMDLGRWWSVVETNLRGNVGLVASAAGSLRESSGGSIVFISSAVGLVGFPGDTAYASSKSAMTGFARSLAKELGGSGVRVNVLAPGFVKTDMTSQVSPAARDRILERTILGRFGTCEEIARAAVFLSEDATFATGTVLSVDGGWTL